MIFIDTGAFVARFRASDDYHAPALRGWAELQRGKTRMFTTNIVLLEAAKLLGGVRGFKWAAARLEEWLSSEKLTIFHSDKDAEIAAAEWMARFADQEIGPADCISFVFMQRHRIKRAFAFDRDFRVAGFELWPTER